MVQMQLTNLLVNSVHYIPLKKINNLVCNDLIYFQGEYALKRLITFVLQIQHLFKL